MLLFRTPCVLLNLLFLYPQLKTRAEDLRQEVTMYVGFGKDWLNPNICSKLVCRQFNASLIDFSSLRNRLKSGEEALSTKNAQLEELCQVEVSS